MWPYWTFRGDLEVKDRVAMKGKRIITLAELQKQALGNYIRTTWT